MIKMVLWFAEVNWQSANMNQQIWSFFGKNCVEFLTKF